MAARPEVLLDRLDDFERLGGHMSGSSAMMGGGGMTYQFDEARGRAMGSTVRMAGYAIGPYEMGFQIAPRGEASRLRMWIDYELPPGLGAGPPR